MCRGAPNNLAMCKTHRPQNFRAPRILWYSFGDICRSFQHSHLKNHEFHFFTKHNSQDHLAMSWCTDQFGHVQNPPNLKLSSTKNYMIFICGHFKSFQPSHVNNHEFYFFTKQPTKPSTCVVVHRPTWPCAKPINLKTFVHQEFYSIHFGTFVSHLNHHISKITNFIFSQKQPTKQFSNVVVH